jgi:hypothetical protein
MKNELKNSLIFSLLYITFTIMLSTTLVHGNVSFGQAVDLIPIQTGNATLDKGLPGFYDCIDEKIDESKGVEADPYFEKEPTKHEVTTCYNEVFILNSDAQSSTDNSDAQSSTDNSDAQSSTDNSERSDIERFNSLFGFTS